MTVIGGADVLGRSAVTAARLRNSRPLVAHLEILASIGPVYAFAALRQGRRYARDAARIDAALYRKIWTHAAEELGAEVTVEAGGFLRIGMNGRTTRVHRQWTALDDEAAVRASLDKVLVSERLRALNLPLPESVECGLGDLTDAFELLQRAGTVVVKPARGTGGGMGVTAGIAGPDQLRRAAIIAARRSSTILVETSVPGPVFRILFLDGEVVDVVRRDPPSVTGNGGGTIRQLLLEENERRLGAAGDLGLQLITPTLDTVYALARQGLLPGPVPPPATSVQVRTVTNKSGPRDSHTVRELISGPVIAEARRGVEPLGLRLAGVAAITAEPS